jgi:anhydro-N-acetylmuramic acid kinase
MKVLGMISGTSHDGIDVAVVDFELRGEVLHGHVSFASSTGYDPRLPGRSCSTTSTSPPPCAGTAGRWRPPT